MQLSLFKEEVPTILQGNCLEIMETFSDNSIDCIVTDPPYGISFMGKDWDREIPNITFWKEMLRICKPGAILLAFGGSRTFHRLTCTIEDAGWKIRDVIMWIYSQGFPKSYNISKNIDKHGGTAISWFGEWLRKEREKRGMKQNELSKYFPSKTGGLTGCVSNWELGVYPPTCEQFNKLCEILNVDFEKLEECEREVIGKFKKNYNSISWFISENPDKNITIASSSLAKKFEEYGTALKPAYEPIVMVMKPCEGTFASNAEKWGIAGINIEQCRITSDETCIDNTDEIGRYPSNIILDEEAAQQLDEQRKSKTPRFFYCPKISTTERSHGNNKHPTVKPVKLMEYLLKLVMPPNENAIVLDPFAGSGTTLVAAKNLGFNAIGIEKEQDYYEIAKARLV